MPQRLLAVSRYALSKIRLCTAAIHRLSWIVAAALVSTAAVAADTNYVVFQWEQIRDGIWFGIPQPNSFTTTNAVIIALPGGGTMVVDSNYADFIAKEIIAKAQQVSAGPVRYLINTHAHPDHVEGNAAFKKAFPKIQIIAHQQTCLDVLGKAAPRVKDRIAPLEKDLEGLRAKRVALGENDKDAAAALDRRIAGTELYMVDMKTQEWVTPTTCLKIAPGKKKTIISSGRRMDLYYFGRGHTAGDLVVYLPKEKVLAAGDMWSEGGDLLLNSGIDGRDGSTLEAARTLTGASKLDFDIALVGHRKAIQGKASLQAAIADNNKIVAQIRESYTRGEAVDDALKKILPPPNMGAASWQRAVIRGFEELELRKQLGLPKL